MRQRGSFANDKEANAYKGNVPETITQSASFDTRSFF